MRLAFYALRGIGFALSVSLGTMHLLPPDKASFRHFDRRTCALGDINPPSLALPLIGEDESVRRQREVDFARGSIRYEGGVLSDEIEHLNARYVAGEIDSSELTAAVLASDTACS